MHVGHRPRSLRGCKHTVAATLSYGKTHYRSNNATARSNLQLCHYLDLVHAVWAVLLVYNLQPW